MEQYGRIRVPHLLVYLVDIHPVALGEYAVERGMLYHLYGILVFLYMPDVLVRFQYARLQKKMLELFAIRSMFYANPTA